MERKNIIIGLVLLVIASTSWWLARQEEPEPEAIQESADTADYYLEGFSALNLTVEGKPRQRLSALKMAHFPADDSTELKKPRLTLYDEGRPPWRVQAESGWVSGDGEVILLQGEVRIDRSASPETRPIHIVTSDLRIQPSDNYAETEAPVEVRSFKDTLTAKGLQGWFQPPIRIKLLANVRGRYDVQ